MSVSVSQATTPNPPSALLLSDRLLRLAEEAERGGCHTTAEHLLALAHTVFDDNYHVAKPGFRVSSRGGARVLAS